MCGIVGYIGNKSAKPILIDGLKRLEYRGYDSAGVALYNDKTRDFFIKRTVGHVAELVKGLEGEGEQEHQGIAHTRWATHGAPSEVNAHPHRAGQLVLVHNGIIENHAELRNELKAQGHQFVSQTDTEVFTRLLESRREDILKKKNKKFEDLSNDEKIKIILESLQQGIQKAQGHYAILFMIQSLPGYLFGCQMGAPLVAALGEDALHVASDLQAIVPYTKQLYFLNPGTLFVGHVGELKFFDDALKPRKLTMEKITWSADQVEKGGYEHFMLKEIHEQPMVTADSLSGRLPTGPDGRFIWDALGNNPEEHDKAWANVKRIYLVACGTSNHAAMVAKYYFEAWARIPVEVDLASEFRYRNPILDPEAMVGVISQSGETADTLSALRLANQKGLKTFAICNVPGSSIMREAKFNYPTKAGPEIGVASTKAFTGQVTVLAALALDVARIRGTLAPEKAAEHIGAFARLPHDMERVISHAQEYISFGASLILRRTILFMGRGPMYPISLEGALKLKEITYRHAEGYAAGELKHGPIALVDDGLAAIVMAPTDELFAKTLSNLEEIKSRKGFIIGVGEAANEEFKKVCDHYVPMPTIPWVLAPILYVVPLQFIAYGLAKALGREIDMPRNLAKSVTVE